MPVEGFIGGLLIGLAAAIMLLGLGRIAGVSGLAARATGIADTGASGLYFAPDAPVTNINSSTPPLPLVPPRGSARNPLLRQSIKSLTCPGSSCALAM